ncbi:pilus assembly protein RcpB [Cricetibacter osteomyelitidis]|uniref:Pilus assembly protein RcpB n=1 Tax=Cricetibacter osteomyelitidis TaxID=1521931 RepID=A0A4R2SYR9_9PAST|nr:protein RcpB [Cricetibacter osteomyelitidis]TCP94655.1 pilus assembly protein RcpB [Cricetibacter osteomyelitidis]
MKKLIIKVSFLGLMALSQASLANASELSNADVAQPNTSQDFYRMNRVNRYILPDYSASAFHNVTQSVIRDLGSDKNKKVRILWRDKTAKKSAVDIYNFLVQKGIRKKSIELAQVSMKKAVYPVFVEVAHISAKPAKCRLDTAEDMMGYDPYDGCATKSNQRIQLKF